jgi:hypothetical protein
MDSKGWVAKMPDSREVGGWKGVCRDGRGRGRKAEEMYWKPVWRQAAWTEA